MSSVKKISIGIAAAFESSFERTFATADENVSRLSRSMKDLGRQSSMIKGLEEMRASSSSLSAEVATAEKSVLKLTSAFDKAKAEQKATSEQTKALASKVREKNAAYQEAITRLRALTSITFQDAEAQKKHAASVAAADAELTRLSGNLKSARADLKAHTEEIEKNTEKLKANQDTVAAHKRRLDEAKSTLSSAKHSFESNTTAIKDHEQALKEDGRETVDLTTEQKKLGRELDAVSRKFALEDRSKRLSDTQRTLRGDIASTGFEVAALGLSMAKPISIAAEFEHAMAKVGAQTMASSEELKTLEEAARSLGDKTIFSSSQAAAAEGFLAQAGFQVQEILDSLEGVLGLAAAGDTGLAETAEMASNMLAGFSLDATEMLRVADTMTATFISSNTNLSQLAETMKYVAPIASALGASLEEVSAESGILGNVGIQGSMAGTALRAMYNRLSAPPAGAEEVLNRLKVSAMDAQKNLRPMPEILKDLDKAMIGLGTAEKAEIIKKLFGEEAAAAATELIKKAGSGSLEFEIKKLEMAPAFRSAVKRIQDDLTTDDLKVLSEKFGVSISGGMGKGEQVKELFKVFDGLKGQAFDARFNEIFKFTPKIDKSELQTETDAAKKSLEKLKISTVGGDGQAKSFDNLSKEIESALASLPEPERLVHISALFSKSKDDMRALALEAAKGKASFSNLADGLEKTNSASEIGERLSKTTMGQWKTFQSGLEAVAISVGSIFLPALVTIMETLSPILLQISAFAQEHEILVKVIGFVGVALLANKAGLLAYKAALWLGAGSIDLVTKAQKAWNFVASMNPVGLIILGVAALGYAAYKVYEHWDKIKLYVIPLWEKLKVLAKSFWNFIEPIAQFHPLGFIIKNWEPIFGYFKSLYERLMPFIEPIVNFFTSSNDLKAPETSLPEAESSVADPGAESGLFEKLGALSLPEFPTPSAAPQVRAQGGASYVLHQKIEIKIEAGETAPKAVAERIKKEIRTAFNPSSFNLFDPVGIS